MGNRTHAASLLALGLAFGGATPVAQAAPSSPPPPSATQRPKGPAPAGSTSPNPFLPTDGRAVDGRGTPPAPRTPGAVPTTPPPPSTTPTAAVPTEVVPEAPPQDLSNTWGYSRINDDRKPRYIRDNDPTRAAPNPVGFYSGVSVQGNHVPPLPAKAMGSTPAELTWSGFERTGEGGSRLFYQLNATPTMEQTTSKEGLVLTIRLRNTKAKVRNNRRRLDLRYFKTPVRGAKVRHRGRDTLITIQLKRASTPTVQIIDGKAGYKLLIIDFHEGGAPVVAPAAPTS